MNLAFDRLWRQVRPDSMVRSVLVVAGGNAFAQMVGLATLPLVTRIYSKEDYGLASVFSSMSGLLVIVASGRYEMAIPLPQSDRDALDVISLTTCLAIGTALLCALVTWIWGPWLIEQSQSVALLPYLWLLPLAMLGGALGQSLDFWGTRRRAYGRLARARLSQSLLGAGLSLGVGLAMGGPLGLVLASAMMFVVSIPILAPDLWRTAQHLGYRMSFARMRLTAHQYRQLPAFACLASLLSTAVLLLPILLLAACYGTHVAGWFALAQRTMLLPMGLLGGAVSRVFLGEAAQRLRDDPASLLPLYHRVTKGLMWLGLGIVLLGLAAPLVFGMVFGPEFASAGTYACLLSAACGSQLLTAPTGSIITLRNRQGVQLLLDAGGAVASCSALLLPWWLGASDVVAVAAYAAALTGMNGVSLLVYRRLFQELAT